MQEVSLATLCADTKIWDTKIWNKPAQSNTTRYNNGLTGSAPHSRPGAAVTEDHEVAASNDRNVLSHSQRPESEIKVPSGAPRFLQRLQGRALPWLSQILGVSGAPWAWPHPPISTSVLTLPVCLSFACLF